MHNSWALRFVRSSIDAEEDYLCVSCIVFGGAYHEGCQIRENMRSRIWLRGRIPSGSWQLRGGSPPNFLMFEGQTTEFCGYRHDDSSFLLPSTDWSPDPPAPRWFSPPASFWTVPLQPEHVHRSCMKAVQRQVTYHPSWRSTRTDRPPYKLYGGAHVWVHPDANSAQPTAAIAFPSSLLVWLLVLMLFL